MWIKKIRAISAISMAVALAACGGGGGGGGGGETPSVSLTGTAGKGLLIGADVKAFEVINGSLSATAWSTSTTNNAGAYVLSGSVTSNPIVVVVTANSGTKMLDESQPQADGTFKLVSAPTDLQLRSYVETLTQNDSLQINPLTENAMALASNAVDNNGIKVGLTKNSLLAAKQFAQQLAPNGINPFTATLPATTADLSGNAMGVMMAGMIKKAADDAASCALQCQIEKLTKNVPMTLDASGKGSITGTMATAMTTQKVALLNAGQIIFAGKSTELGSLASAVNATATSATSTAQRTTVASTTVSSSEYETINGLKGFVNTLRESFKTTETKLQAAKTSLDTKYQTLSLQGLDHLSGIVNTVATDCFKNKTTFACSAADGSGVTWSTNGTGWKGEVISSTGRTITGYVTGSISSNVVNFAITNTTVKLGTKTLVELSNLNGQANATVNSSGDATAGIITLNGTVIAHDTTAGSDIAVTLGLTGTEVKRDETAKTFSLKSNMSLASNKNDTLTGNLEVSGVSRDISQTWGTYTYTIHDDYINRFVLNLKATEGTQGEIVALNVNGTRNLLDPTKYESATNYETYDAIATVALAANTTLKLTSKHPSQAILTRAIELQSGASKLSLAGNYARATTYTFDNSKWCANEGGVILCTDNLALSANDGTYTAVVKKSSSGTSADLYKGNANTGTKVGVITNQGMIQVDGKEYSLY